MGEIPKRFALWESDAPLNARDEVVDKIEALIETAVSECDATGPVWLNYLVSYACCLSAIVNAFGGPPLETDKISKWRTAALQTFDSARDDYDDSEAFSDDRRYIESVFDSLADST